MSMSTYFMPPAYFYNRYIPDLCPADQRARLMNMRGLQWCVSQQGNRIGDGQCTALVEMHLRISGAVPGDFRNRKNYIWGAIPNGWVPGDVLQLEDYYFEWTEGNRTRKSFSEHHSAVILSARGGVVEVIEQNRAGVGPVEISKYVFNEKTKGTFRGWRPVGSY